MNAKVSVVLPSLNVADYIEECLASVLNQSLDELEVICVDAGSTDSTREILDDYAKKDSRIVVLHSNVKSYGKQVNMGLDYACGAYVAILETDDWSRTCTGACMSMGRPTAWITWRPLLTYFINFKAGNIIISGRNYSMQGMRAGMANCWAPASLPP